MRGTPTQIPLNWGNSLRRQSPKIPIGTLSQSHPSPASFPPFSHLFPCLVPVFCPRFSPSFFPSFSRFLNRFFSHHFWSFPLFLTLLFPPFLFPPIFFPPFFSRPFFPALFSSPSGSRRHFGPESSGALPGDLAPVTFPGLGALGIAEFVPKSHF